MSDGVIEAMGWGLVIAGGLVFLLSVGLLGWLVYTFWCDGQTGRLE